MVEIGAGTGNLTEALLARGLRVIAIEIEDVLVARLRERFGNRDQVQIVAGDARKLNLRELAGGLYHVVANLPYSVGTRLVVSFVSAADPPRSLTVLLQREVARRLTARPGDMALLSVIVQSYARTRRLFDVPPEAFRPRWYRPWCGSTRFARRKPTRRLRNHASPWLATALPRPARSCGTPWPPAWPVASLRSGRPWNPPASTPAGDPRRSR